MDTDRPSNVLDVRSSATVELLEMGKMPLSNVQWSNKDTILTESLARDGATLVSIDKQTINFTCKCGQQHTKQKSAICKTSGAFCKDCTDRNTQIKRLSAKIALNNKLLEKQASQANQST